MKKKFRILMLFVIIAVFILALTCVLLRMHNAKNIESEIVTGKDEKAIDIPMEKTEHIEEQKEIEEIPQEEIDTPLDEKKQEKVLSTYPEICDDFKDLYLENDEIIGWLKVADFVDLPVMFSDNSYYLSHSFEKEDDVNGTLFVNMYNSLEPRDDVILIHGHNMRDGSMFGFLDRFEELEYVAEHPIVMFRTVYDTQDIFYTPVAAFHASMLDYDPEYFDIVRFNFENDVTEDTYENSVPVKRQSKEYREYLDDIHDWSLWQPKTEVDVEDKLIMLVTCSYYQNDGRFMLICRQLRDGETPESITALYKNAKGSSENP